MCKQPFLAGQDLIDLIQIGITTTSPIYCKFKPPFVLSSVRSLFERRQADVALLGIKDATSSESLCVTRCCLIERSCNQNYSFYTMEPNAHLIGQSSVASAEKSVIRETKLEF